jgi:urea transport system ATP-binding protein
MGIVLVEQYLDFAQRLADDFFLLDRGAVVVSGKRVDLTDERVPKYLTF